MKYTSIYIFIITFLFFSCKNKQKNKDNNLSNYSTIKEIKFNGKLLGYSFYNSKKKDSIVWEEPHVPAIHFTITGNKISRIHIKNYIGEIPDSLDLSNLTLLTLENSVLEGNTNVFLNTKVSTIETYNSLFYDSLINLKIFPNLNWIEIANSKTNFIINENISLLQLSYVETYPLFPPREIKIDFDKLPNLKALSFKCRNCEIEIPHDSLRLTYKKDENGIEITKGSYPIISSLDNK